MSNIITNELFEFDLNDESINQLINGEPISSLFNQSILNGFLKDKKYDLSDEIKLTWDFNELEKQVRDKVSPHIYNWYDQDTSAGNSTFKSISSFSNYELKPNYLNPNKQLELKKELKLYSKSLGTTILKVKNPIFTCAYGSANLYSDVSDEKGVALASVNNNITYTIPALTKYNIEDIQNTIKDKLIDNAFTIYQIYLTSENDINISIIERAKCAGVSVLLLTIDAGSAHAGIKMINSSADITFCSKISGNILSDPVFNKNCYINYKCIGTQDKNVIKKIRELLKIDNNIELSYNAEIAFNYARQIQLGGMSKQNDCKDVSDPMYTWSLHNIVNIAHSKEKLSKYTLENENNFKPLPIIIKGILTKENAESSIDADADGVYVTNHGGRFLYNSTPPLEVLSEIKEFVKSKNKDIGVWYDGGIRNGNEILMAFAKGAEFVGIGRPIIYASVLYGEVGVSAMIKQLLFFLKQQCVLCGINNFEDYTSLTKIITTSKNLENKYLNKYLKYKNKYLQI